MKKYWFYLESYTFIWEERNKILFYNSISKTSISFCKSIDIMPVVESLLDKNNMNCVEVSEKQIKKRDVSNLVNMLRNSFSADLIPISDVEGRPLSLPSYLNYQRDNTRLEKEVKGFLGDNIMSLLFEMHIYLHFGLEDGMQNSRLCNSNSSIKINRVILFLEKMRYIFNGVINVHFESINQNSEIDKLIKYFNSYRREITYYVTLRDIELDRIPWDLMDSDNNQIKVCATARDCENTIANFLDILGNIKSWRFSICNEKEYQEIDAIIQKYDLRNTEIIPVFDGDNIGFFRDYVYINENDLRNPDICKQEIFAHQRINTNDFGKLIITSNGEVFANPNFQVLGTIEDDIRELIYKELTEGQSWLRIRDMEPCCNCVYQWLCPSPSNYELALGRPNLCHVKPKGTPGVLD